jgi:hypothetical protein
MADIPEEAVAPPHKHQYHALWAHLGPHGRQDIHYHPCTDEDEPWACADVLVGYGRECGGSEQPHVRTGLPLPDDLAVPGEPAPAALRPEDDPLLQMMAKAVPMVPESAVAEAVTVERARLFTAIRHKIPLTQAWRGEALDLIYEVWRETDG